MRNYNFVIKDVQHPNWIFI